jgi:hypothetical protein
MSSQFLMDSGLRRISFQMMYAPKQNFDQKTASPADFVGNIVCSFKFLLEVGVEESFVNAPRITDHGSALLNLTSLFALVVFLMSGAFTIDSSRPTLRINLNELPIEFVKLTVTSEASTVFCC